MGKTTFEKDEILNLINKHKDRWKSIKGNDQDVTHENFIDNVLWTLDMIACDFERA